MGGGDKNPTKLKDTSYMYVQLYMFFFPLSVEEYLISMLRQFNFCIIIAAYSYNFMRLTSSSTLLPSAFCSTCLECLKRLECLDCLESLRSHHQRPILA